MTAARARAGGRGGDRRAVLRASRKTWTCGRSRPGIGGTSASEPVASTQRSNGSAVAVVERGTRRPGRAPSTRAPTRTSTPCSSYHVVGAQLQVVGAPRRRAGRASDDAVVREPRLLADQRQRRQGVALAQLLADRLAGDAAADDDDAVFSCPIAAR